MNASQFKKVASANWSFIAVMFFFITHGYSENQFLVPIKGLIWLLIELIVVSIAVFALSTRIFRNNRKANIFTSFLFVIILFFGAFQDFLAGFRPLSSFARLVIFFPVIVLLIVLFFIWIKKSRRSLNRVVFFLNILLLIYIVVDVGVITTHSLFRTNNHDSALGKHGLVPCDTCAKPSVYLIILDSYFGSQGLKEYFHYDNSAFENFLTQQGFHVSKGTYSNYLFTIFSMASLLNMEYPEVGEPITPNHYGFNKATEAIRNNTVCRFFKNQGYMINNFSTFDIPGVPAGYNSGLLPDKVQLITNQTMYYRLVKYLPPFLIREHLVTKLSENIENEFIDNNEKMMQHTLSDAQVKRNAPVFTYLHLMMPHEPFVFDSTGRRTHILTKQNLTDNSFARAFLQYQVYVNKRISAFIAQLQKETAKNAVIVLMSDHGYQPAWREKNIKLGLYNLNAVYLPQKNYTGWYDGISNVNQFRVLFNTLFHQSLPMLPDSVVYK